MLTLDFIQQSILAQTTTTPTYLVDIEWGGQQRWSTRADHTVDGLDYTGGAYSAIGTKTMTYDAAGNVTLTAWS